LDITASMSDELHKTVRDLNVSRQAIIKTLVRQGLDHHYLAQRARRPQAPSQQRLMYSAMSSAYFIMR